MADAADIASDIEQERITRILNNRQQNQSQSQSQISALECAECGDEIPEARRIALPGVANCVCCQELNEGTANIYAPPPYTKRPS